MVDVPKSDLKFLLNALESVQVEQEQLTLDNDWYVSDCTDLVESGLEIVRGHLGLHPTPEDEEDYDIE